MAVTFLAHHLATVPSPSPSWQPHCCWPPPKSVESSCPVQILDHHVVCLLKVIVHVGNVALQPSFFSQVHGLHRMHPVNITGTGNMAFVDVQLSLLPGRGRGWHVQRAHGVSYPSDCLTVGLIIPNGRSILPNQGICLASAQHLARVIKLLRNDVHCPLILARGFVLLATVLWYWTNLAWLAFIYTLCPINWLTSSSSAGRSS